MNKGILDIDVSFYENVQDKKPRPANLLQILTGEEYKERVTEVRNQRDEVLQKKLKNELPCYTIAGVFEESGGDPIKPTSLIGIDIDKKDNTNVTNFGSLKELIKTAPFVAYCGKSCRGEGYFCIVPIRDYKRHRQHFESIKKDFESWGVKIDGQCKDIGRRRFVSYDSEPYINNDAQTYDFVIDTKPNNAGSATARTWSDQEAATRGYRIAEYIHRLETAKVDITSDYNDWLNIGLALANEMGESGRKCFHAVSKYCAKYDPAETDNKFDNCLSRGRGDVHIGTFIKLCQDHNLQAQVDFNDIENDLQK